MPAALLRAVKTVLPYIHGGAVANDFSVRKIESNTTHAAWPIPDAWNGSLVGLRAFTNNVTVGFSTDSTSEVDKDVPATVAGASAKVGLTIVAGTLFPFQLPTWKKGTTAYIVHEAAANTTLFEVSRLE